MLGYEPRAVGADLRRLLRHLPRFKRVGVSGRPGQAVGCRLLLSDSVQPMTRTQRTGAAPASQVATDEDGVRLPRLRFKDVAVRGAVQGIAAVVLLFVGMFFVADHHDRETFLAVVAGFSAVLAGTGSCSGASSGRPAGVTSGGGVTCVRSPARQAAS